MKQLNILLLLLLCSCATLFGNKYQEVEFTSTPSGLDVYVRHDLIGKTPVKTILKARDHYRIMYSDDPFGADFIIHADKPQTDKLNKGLCLADNILSVFTLFTNIVINNHNGACNKFADKYHKDVTQQLNMARSIIAVEEGEEEITEEEPQQVLNAVNTKQPILHSKNNTTKPNNSELKNDKKSKN
jgi:hypothetical protein